MRIFIITILSLIYFQSYGQETSVYFVLIYTTGENWDADKSFSEQVYSSEHSQFLSTLKKEGKIAIGARYSDKGFIVLKVKDETEARQLLEQDISVTHKTFKAEFFPFSPFYYGCIEKE